ncbi:MAG TPA: thioredoxin-dependent thiol peroxidase [Flavobacteriales bacterium]|nr:thioredoxin-dependent thiol peroxidase [Flavobacteriales bacterium]HRJ34838.1 thioredoxin-dependent thiol peroxidase [Flavobacteriales bacterium]HRJ39641.1 thioredoxin-dependent thiol peroxidase [Flavobacteriales bacterium]
MNMLKEGDKAPSFTYTNEKGKKVSLKDLKGKVVALFFYPKDLTPGCTAEACNLRDYYSELKKKGIVVIGVSADSEKMHERFREKHQLPYPLIADEEKELIQAYGVWGPKVFMGKKFDGINRTTFIIDEAGKIRNVIAKVKTKEHAEQIFELIK